MKVNTYVHKLQSTGEKCETVSFFHIVPYAMHV